MENERQDITAWEFSLKPFHMDQARRLELSGMILRRYSSLQIEYVLTGALKGLCIPQPAPKPARMDGLWSDTCFELFLAVPLKSEYWEFNLAPAGDWNVYRFADYRKGMQEERAFTTLPFETLNDSNSFHLTLNVDLKKIFPAGADLDVGVSAVLKETPGQVSYLALAHYGIQPDFHRRDGFTIKL